MQILHDYKLNMDDHIHNWVIIFFNIWTHFTFTGDQIASYTELNYANTVCCVDLHPGEDMVAFCAFGDNQNVLVYTYDKEC